MAESQASYMAGYFKLLTYNYKLRDLLAYSVIDQCPL